MPGPVIEIDASQWRTGVDFYDALIPALRGPGRHGRNQNALIDTMVYGVLNRTEPPYTVHIVGTTSMAPEARNEMLGAVDFLAQIPGTENKFTFQIEP
jgi:hypothetical protein